MNSGIREADLRKPVVEFLRSLGCNRLEIEVPLLDRGVDVFGVKTGRGTQSYAVELKLRDWQKALKQAAVYQLCADYCYVAMPCDKATRLDQKDFEEAGVGILAVNPNTKDVHIVLMARKSDVKRNAYSSSVRRSVEQ
jgi:hypothetical protein